MRWLVRAAVVLVLIAIAAAAGGAWFVNARVRESYQGFQTAEQFVDITPGTGASGIGQQLADAGIVRDRLTFRAALWLTGRARELKAGEYRFDRPLSPLEVVDRLARGDVYKRLITFREGLTIPEMAQVFEQRGFGQAREFEQAASNKSLIADLDPAATDLEGYLFPETYALPRGTPADEVVAQMVGLFRRVYTEQLRDAASRAELSLRQVVTLASLVEKETARADERPLVAAVYRNRLKLGMAMQADPTVIYALQHAGRYDGNLSRDDLQFDSPYNTYRHAGLPPGPIAAPGLGALQAAVAPSDVPYVYFVSRNDGSHVFATTLAEHNRNVQEWQVDYFRRLRQQASPPKYQN